MSNTRTPIINFFCWLTFVLFVAWGLVMSVVGTKDLDQSLRAEWSAQTTGQIIDRGSPFGVYTPQKEITVQFTDGSGKAQVFKQVVGGGHRQQRSRPVLHP